MSKKKLEGKTQHVILEIAKRPVLLSAVSQRGRKQESLGREETECVLNLLPFLRKYLWRRMKAAGECVCVRVWLSLRLYLVCEAVSELASCTHTYARTHTHSGTQPASRKINGVVAALLAAAQHQSQMLTLTEKCFCIFNHGSEDKAILPSQ